MANELSNLSPRPGARRNRMRLGRGEGSGKGKTAGRGSKGQRHRGNVPIGFEGGQMPLHRRLPKRGFKNIHGTDYIEIGLDRIAAKFEAGAVVDIHALKAQGIISKKIEKETKKGSVLLRDIKVKILGNGELDKSLTIVADKFTKGALQKIEAAGGTATVVGASE
jgi:large subunit ribosomal protein L15